MTASLCIDVFSDILCPWCFIGSTRLEQRWPAWPARSSRALLPPFFGSDLPKAGVSLREKLQKKFGVDPKQLWGRVEAAAAESGLTLDLSLQPQMYPTGAAHTLLRHAHAKGTQPQLVLALFRAYFQEAKNIADESVLAEIAAKHGFARDEAVELATNQAELELTRDEALSAAQGGIRGVPFFIFAGKLAVSGHKANVLAGAIRQRYSSKWIASHLPPIDA